MGRVAEAIASDGEERGRALTGAGPFSRAIPSPMARVSAVMRHVNGRAQLNPDDASERASEPLTSRSRPYDLAIGSFYKIKDIATRAGRFHQ